MNRKQIATELMTGCQRDEDWGEDERTPWTDHQAIADAIISGKSVDEILNMREMENWPDTYVWVKNQFEISKSAAALGSIKSDKKAASSRENGKKGGRPRKHDDEWIRRHTCPVCGTRAPEIYDADESPAWDCDVCMAAKNDD